ncbi:phytoene desaturase family protein [Paenibacillus sp. YPG26]|uniref:phytoene desaturase family protein n=1 Tax=Paenibacillus sp. YPG26 TaxID=2878915 RepID=UPI00203D00AC|nr:phytoene desaturase family protein [Paenibacillus sp. YPG26]USB32908.1 phytoene desaturase [Paenibacillus sp. YPG26]
MAQRPNGRRVVVIGAGPGGLAAAMLLAHQGYEVEVLEKNDRVGGRSSGITLGEYRFDRGATFLMMPQLLEELFTAAGRSLDDYIVMKKLSPLYSLHFGDTVFAPSADPEATAASIARLFPGEEAGYRRFMKDEEIKFGRVMPLLQRPFTSLRDYFKPDVFKALPKLHLTETVYERLSRYFEDERLKLAFTFQAKYLGMSPWNCPGTFTILSFLEHRYGLFHPVGGIHQVFEAMARIIREDGGRIRLSTGVKRVITRNGQAEGVVLDNGERIEADHVVLNADFAAAMNSLFPPGELKKYTPDKLSRKKYSLSTCMMYLGINGAIDLPHHSVYFAEDYRRNVDDITRRMQISKDFSLYIHNPSVVDPTLAPPGKSSLYVLVPVPNLKSGTDWSREAPAYREAILDRLERIPALVGIRNRIEEELIFTPQDWESQLHVYQGATFNLSHSLNQMMLRRPHNRFEEVEGVWLVGGGTHPGSGLPTIFESAKISVSMLMQQDELRKTAGSGSPPMAGKGGVV